MIRGVEILDSVQSRAYDLYVQKNPFPAWLPVDSSQPDQPFDREFVSAENKIEFASGRLEERANLKESGSYTDNDADCQPESADLIDLELRSFVQPFLIFICRQVLILASLAKNQKCSVVLNLF